MRLAGRSLGAFAYAALLVSAVGICFTANANAQVDDEADQESPWTMSLSERFMSRDVKYGADLSDDAPTLGSSVLIEHDAGFEAGIGVSHLLGGIGGMQRWYLSGAYTLDFSDYVSASAELTHYGYPNDSLTILAGLSNEASLSLDFTLSPIALSLSFDHYFGDRTANFIGLDMFAPIKSGQWTFIPGVSLTAMSENVPVKALKKNKDKGVKGVITATEILVSGFSSASFAMIGLYSAGKGFTLSGTVALVYSAQADVSARTWSPVLSLGAKYAWGM